MGIRVHDLEISQYNDTSVKLIFKYSLDEIEHLKNYFGKYEAIIDSNKFKENISKLLECIDENWIFDEIKYICINSFDRIEFFLNQKLTRFLHKDKVFEYQKEYRLVIDESIDSTKVIKIEEMKKSVIILEIDDFKKELELTLNFK